MANLMDTLKQRLFGNWAPEDQEWGLKEFINDTKGEFDWGEAENRLSRGAITQADFDAAVNTIAGSWFGKVGHKKTKERNAARDRGEDVSGLTPEQKAEADGKAKADTDRVAAEGRTAKINSDIDAFYEELGKPMDPNDPEVMRVAAMAGRSAAGQAYGQGIEGGLSVQNTEASAGNAAAQTFAAERARRQGLQAQIGQLRSNTGLSQQDYLDRQRQLDFGEKQYRDGLNYDNEMAQYQQGMGRSQALWGTVGGLGTGLLAGIASGGNPAAIAGGFAGGSTTAAGLAGSLYGPPPKRKSSGGW